MVGRRSVRRAPREERRVCGGKEVLHVPAKVRRDCQGRQCRGRRLPRGGLWALGRRNVNAEEEDLALPGESHIPHV